MQKELSVVIASDQPTMCPICGLRSEIILEILIDGVHTQKHSCRNVSCEFQFFVEFELR